MQAETVVRMKAIDGTWEVTGRDRFPGVVPESVDYDFNDWGADTASFLLRRQPGDRHIDLSAFTDTEIEVGGVKVWDGRVRDNPKQEGSEFQVAVQAAGIQYHLDDDVYARTYVHTSMSDWQDARSKLGTILTRYTMAGQISNDRGTVQIGWPKGTELPGNDNRVGVVLDLGPGNTAKRIVVEYEGSAAATTLFLYARATDTEDSEPANDAISNISLTTLGASGTQAGTFGTAKRYVHLFLYYSGVATTTAADHYIRFRAIRVFTDTAYESGNASVLRSHHVVRDAIDRATVFISKVLVQDSTFNIPEFAPTGTRTPRENLSAINAYENRRLMVDLDRNLIFEPRPITPALTSGPGATFDNASDSVAEDIENKVVVEGEGPDGAAIQVVRYAVQQPGALVQRVSISSPAINNPSFDTNAASWTPTAGTFVRDTAVSDTPPASGKWTAPSSAFLDGSTTGTFKMGRAYTLILRLRRVDPASVLVLLGVGGDNSFVVLTEASDAGFISVEVVWVPTADRSGAVIELENLSLASAVIHVDSMALYQSTPTLVDRRGFMKAKILPIESRITTLVGQRFGDLYLQDAMRTTTRGTLDVPPGGLVRTLTGETVPPEQIGRFIGEQVRLADDIDPDTGGIGRDVYIVGGGYSTKTQRAQLRLDSSRGNFQALLSRLAIVTGNTTGPSV